MEIKEAISFLDDLMIKNNFAFSSRTECLYQNKEKIENMHNIFDLRTSEDFTYLYAISTLLSDNPKAVNEYLLHENTDSNLIENIREPNRKDLLLVATAMEENPNFFSLAYYWVGIVEDRLSKSNSSNKNNENIIYIDLFHNQTVEVDYPVYASAAGSPGFNNITRIPIDLLGELEIRGNSETEEVVFILFINKEYQTLKFELTIDFEVNNSIYSATIEKNYSHEDEEVRSEPVQVDFTKGLRLKKINWKAL
ncbi:MAG: hypothetical protein K6E51_13255 [Treponema sp.]|nr:hypothetical protein [Treponema sp.]